VLTVQDHGARLCDGLTRREWLRVGGLSLAGLSLPEFLAARSPAASRPVKAKACIVLFLLGGPPQHETWDPKPDAPAEVRGEFKPIPTTTPGLMVSELMPRTARLTERICVLRAVSTNDRAHSSSGYYLTTGRPHQPRNAENARPGAPNDWPCLTAVLQHLRRGSDHRPAAIVLPERLANCGNIPWPGQDGGWLGRSADPWTLTCDPSAADFQVPGCRLPAEIPPLRFDARRRLLTQVNHHLDQLERPGAVTRYTGQAQQAFDLLCSSQARQAFDLHREPAAVRQRYGLTRFGQSLLLARRLVESGVALVQVNWPRAADDRTGNVGIWDLHRKLAVTLKTRLMPVMDQAYSALLEDLAARGLLDETLVVWMGEFGRTPKFNGAAGRDHWGNVFSLALAGGGIRGGQVHGASDRQGAQPRDGRVTPPDLLATIYHCLGIRPDTEIRDPVGRPVPITRGEVVRQVL
jgi:uncharacterized protein (DUF1501 family)